MKEILDNIIWKNFHNNERFPFIELTKPYINDVREEILACENLKSVEIYADDAKSMTDDNLSARDENIARWTSSSLLFYCIKNPAVINMLPKVNEMLTVIPGVVSATILSLKGGTHLPAHSGYSPLVLRAHLGILVPEPDKTVLRVGDEKRQWAEKEWMVFDDYLDHEVWHSGTKTRKVLSIDFVKPETGMTPREVAEHFFYRKEGARMDDFILDSAPLTIWKKLLERGTL